MSTEELMLLCIFLLPLLGAVVNGFFLRKVHYLVNTAVATAAIFIPFILSLIIVIGYISKEQSIHLNLFNWFVLSSATEGDITIPFSLLADRLSGLMLLVITGVGSLIHLYSGEYMSHEPRVYRFFAYLNLFVFSMLALVLGSNMLSTFLGWEGVGLCSYLLIGYWYQDTNNAAAGMKAFIVNRIGDFGFLMAMFLAYNLFGSFEYVGAGSLSESALLHFSTMAIQHPTQVTFLGLSILLAVTGKSAQVPLYIWLPDAMAGPTPVSALIHAATMVTAGVYFMTRTSFLLVQSPTVMLSIAIVGAVTALFAATIGFAQNDIKKVLAYSTVSQLGFMVLACGVGAFQFGVAHLITHAFFKALLFLGAGSVILAMHHEQDIQKMGGLFSKLPITAVTFVLGTLAIIGFPMFSGFMSKDEILYNAWAGPFGHPALWTVGALAALCTAFYMTRLVVLVFFGKTRASEKVFSHVHENNWYITFPLIVLAILSVIGGIIAVPAGISALAGIQGENFITSWLTPVLEPANIIMQASMQQAAHESHALEYLLMSFSTLGMFIMVGIAYKLYRNGPINIKAIYQPLYKIVRDKWRVDELYNSVFVNPLRILGDKCYYIVDKMLIEGVVNGFPVLLRNSTQAISSLNSGLLRTYAKTMFVGLLIISIVIMWSIK